MNDTKVKHFKQMLIDLIQTEFGLPPDKAAGVAEFIIGAIELELLTIPPDWFGTGADFLQIVKGRLR